MGLPSTAPTCEADGRSAGAARSTAAQAWLEWLSRLLPDVESLALVDTAGAVPRVRARVPTSVCSTPQAIELASLAGGKGRPIERALAESGTHLLALPLILSPHAARSKSDGKPASTPGHVLLFTHRGLQAAQRDTLIRLARWAAQAPLRAPRPAATGAPDAAADGRSPGRARRDGIGGAELLELALTHRSSTTFGVAIVNLLQARFGCARVTLGRRSTGHHQRPSLVAVSGQPTVDERRVLARQLGTAVQEALQAGHRLQYPASTMPPDVPPVAETPALARLHEEQGRHAIVCLPLTAQKGTELALVMEWAAKEHLPAPQLAQLELCTAAIAPLLGLLDDAGAGSWQRCRHRLASAWRQHLPLRLAGYRPGGRSLALALLLAIGAMAIIPITHEVSARAFIEAADRQVIIAALPGYVRSTHAKAGEHVSADQVLATLDDTQPRLETDKWRSEQRKNAQEFAAALATHDRIELSRLRADAQRIDAELTLAERRLARTEVRAPFTGVLISGDLSSSLGAPVQAGDVLFELASADRYTLMLEVDDHDIGTVTSGQQVLVRMAALPGQRWQATLDSVSPVAVAAQGSSVFRLPATLLGEASALRPGMEGVGRIQTEQASMLWVYLHPLIDRLRLLVWQLGV